MGAGVKWDPEEGQDGAAERALHLIAQIDRFRHELPRGFFERYVDHVERHPDRIERHAPPSIDTGHAYAHVHDQEIFAMAAVRRLCYAAHDDLFQVTRVPARKRPAAIRRWSKRWHVDAVGMRAWAVAQIECWEVSGRGTMLVARVLLHGTWMTWMLDPRNFVTRKDYLKTLTEWAEEQWDSCHRMKEHRTKPGRQFSERCEWLARFQVNRETFSDIARSVGMSRQSVTEVIENVARLLDLPLRPRTPGGRPKK